MQTTLLSLAFAIILALVAALVAPFYIDWNQYRPFLEARVAALIGQPVRITGPIEARLLPAPSVKLRAVEIGAAGDANVMRARSLDLEFALGALLRGQVHAVEMHVTAPEFTLAVDGAGRIDGPGLAVRFNPGAVAVERLTVDEGRAVLLDAGSGSRTVLEQLSFKGDLRSLVGPFKGDGAFVLGGQSYPYRLTTGRLGDEGFRLRLSVDAVFERPYSIDADGTVTLDHGAPAFEGAFTLARPVGIALPNGQMLVSEPWRATSRMKATPVGAKFEQIEFQYGPEEASARLTGSAQLTLGAKPLLNAVLTGRQLDLDRFVSANAPALPLAALKIAAETLVAGWRPPIRTELGIAVDSLTLSGATIQNVRGDLVGDTESWTFDKLEFRAPGFTQVRMSGRLGVRASGATFGGPVDVETTDARTLVNWLAGATASPPAALKSWHARGNLTLGAGTIAIDGLKTEFDRETVEGRISYTWANGDRPPRLDAEIKAAELDLDAVQAFAGGALAGSGLQRPREIALAAAIGRFKYAGVDARRVDAKLQVDADGLALDRVSVGDFGGAALAASGRIDTTTALPRGTVTIDLDAKSLDGLTALLAKFAPDTAEPLQRLADRLAPAKLRATLSVAGAENGVGTASKLALDGRLGATRVNLAAEAAGDPSSLGIADIRLDGHLDTENGAALLRLAGLDAFLTLDKVATRVDLSAAGPIDKILNVRTRLQGGGLDAAANGTLRLFGDAGPSAALELTVASADARPLWRAAANRVADRLPINLTTRLALTPKGATFEDLSGSVAGVNVRGKLALPFAEPARLSGEIETDRVDAAAFVAAGIGMPLAAAKAGNTLWSAEPFRPGLFGELDAVIGVRAAEAALGSGLVLRQARGTLRLNKSELALDDVEGDLGGGRLSGQLALHPVAGGVSALVQVALKDADAAALIAAEGKSVTGKLGVRAEVSGTGLSAAALIGSLGGAGTITLQDGQMAGLDPAAFQIAAQAVDRSGSLDAATVRDLVGAALDNGRLKVAEAEADVTISGGQVNLAALSARTGGAELAAAGHVGLGDGALDGRLTLTGRAPPSGTRGRPQVAVLLKGPLLAPKRTIDVSAFVGWLTLRSVEQQSRKLEAIESGKRETAIDDGWETEATVSASSPAPALPKNFQLPRPRPTTAAATGIAGARKQPIGRAPEPVGPVAAPAPASAENGDQTRTAIAVPASEPAPTLPPPIEIGPAPGAGEHKLVRPVAKPEAQARPRAAAKPVGPPAPAPSRSVLDLINP